MGGAGEKPQVIIGGHLAYQRDRSEIGRDELFEAIELVGRESRAVANRVDGRAVGFELPAG